MEYHYDCYKTPGKTSASTAVRRLALWAELYQKAYALFTFITRSARLIPLPRAARCKSPLGCLLIAHEVWRLESSSPREFRRFRNFAKGENLCISYRNSLLQKPKDSSWSMPLLSPQGKNDRLRYCSAEWTVSTPWPERFQLCWHLRLRLGNVSKLPFLSACT